VRQAHCTITPAVVRSTARAALSPALPWKPYGRRVSVARLLDLLLLVGLALLPRPAWVWLTAQRARTRGARPSAWVGELPLQRLLDRLAEALEGHYPETKVIHLGQPLLPLNPDVAA
jgi:hypothetical protein